MRKRKQTYTPEQKARKAEKARQWWHEHGKVRRQTPEGKAKQAENRRRWYLKYRQREIERQKAYREANPLKGREASKRWIENHPERFRAAKRRYNAKRRAAGTTRSSCAKEWRETIIVELLRRDGFDCGICHTSLTGKIQVDHIKAVKDGGNHCLENLRLAHAKCNQTNWRVA